MPIWLVFVARALSVGQCQSQLVKIRLWLGHCNPFYAGKFFVVGNRSLQKVWLIKNIIASLQYTDQKTILQFCKLLHIVDCGYVIKEGITILFSDIFCLTQLWAIYSNKEIFTTKLIILLFFWCLLNMNLYIFVSLLETYILSMKLETIFKK